VRAMRIYWIVGGRAMGNAVDDPPIAGWQTALVIAAPRAFIFCPFTLRSIDVPADAAEIRTGVEHPLNAARLADIILKRWDDAARRKQHPADMHAAAVILARLGHGAPLVEAVEAVEDTPSDPAIRRARYGERKYCELEREAVRARKKANGWRAEISNLAGWVAVGRVQPSEAKALALARRFRKLYPFPKTPFSNL
jgi:hypothetical protein